MLTLLIFRHAKSSWDEEALKDIDRPLSERGIAAAPVMGAFMVREGLLPDLVLSSPSARTRATSALAFEACQPPPEVRFEDALYLASPKTMHGRIRRVEAGVRRLMLLGHNPGLQALALDLAGGGPKDLIAELSTKLPTAGLVVIAFDAAKWADVGSGGGRLRHFVTPRKLAA